MKIGITNNFYLEEDGTTNYQLMKKHGFDCADYQYLCNIGGECYTKSEDEVLKMLTEERKAANDAGIEFSQVHGPWYVYDTSEEKRRSNMVCMKRCVMGTKALGSKYMVVHPVMPYGWNKEEDPAFAVEVNRAYFTELCDYAADYGVDICIENMPLTVKHIHTIASMESLAVFCKQVDKPNFKVCMDTGHANITDDDIFGGMRQCGSLIKVLHLHDNNGRADDHRFPYEGSFDWATFKTVIKEIGFDGTYSIESSFNGSCPYDLKETYLITLAKAARSIAE